MRIYLNTNIYCRPLDDLKQERILTEALASMRIFLLSLSRLVNIIASEMVFVEIGLITEPAKREAAEDLVLNLTSEGVKIIEDIEIFADSIRENCDINDYADCLHLSSACFRKCLYFITCDDELDRKADNIEKFLQDKDFRLKIRNPIEFLKEEGVI